MTAPGASAAEDRSDERLLPTDRRFRSARRRRGGGLDHRVQAPADVAARSRSARLGQPAAPRRSAGVTAARSTRFTPPTERPTNGPRRGLQGRARAPCFNAGAVSGERSRGGVADEGSRARSRTAGRPTVHRNSAPHQQQRRRWSVSPKSGFTPFPHCTMRVTSRPSARPCGAVGRS